MVKIFLKIYDFFSTNRAAMWAVLALTIVFAVVGAARMSFKEDVADFLPSDKINEKTNWAFSHMGANNKVILTLSSEEGSRGLLMDAADFLVEAIRAGVDAEFINSITYIVDDESISSVTDFIVDNLPYFLDEEDYAHLDSLVSKGSCEGELAVAKGIVASPVGGLMKKVIARDPLLLSAGRLKKLESFSTGSSFSTEDSYIFTGDGDALVTLDLVFSSSDTWRAGKFIEQLDEVIAATEAAMSGEVTIDPLGSVYIAYTNSSRIKRDSFLSIILAVLLIALLLVSYFRSGRSILLVGVTILYGFLVAFGLTTLISGSLSLIVIGMGAVIIGIAANYPLHYISHIRQGYSPRASLSDIVLPLTTGNITTVGAFLSLLFIASPAMQDFGIFAALLLVGTILFTLIFLPHFTIKGDNEAVSKESKFWEKVAQLDLSSSRIAVLAVVVLTIFFSFFEGKVKFDSDLHNINYMTERQKANMDRMLELAQGSNSVCYVAVLGDDMDSALDRYDSLIAAIDSLPGTLGRGDVTVSGVRDFVPGPTLQDSRLSRWNSFVAKNGAVLKKMVASAADRQGFTTSAFAPFEALLDKEYPVRSAEYFKPLTDQLAAGCLIMDEDRCGVLSTIGSDSDICAQVASVFDDADVVVFDSGSMTENMISSLSNEFDTVLYVCAFIVFLLLVISFGRLELAGIAFLPLTLGWIWILGAMALLGIDFNIVNIILATFIFGMGDDYTIFITEGMIYEHTYGKKMLKTYEKTVILSALIMFAGIGSLIVARHPAMLSLSYVIMIGMFSVVLMADVLPPFLYRLLTCKKGKKRTEPLTLVNFTATVLAFIIFLAGALIVTIAGFFLITLTFGSKKGKYLYHSLLSKVCGFVFRHVFLTTHSVECGEAFGKPAIIVANHQSHLDLMATLMLTPKMIVVTNKWVWNNPLYGFLIRYADFCPVENMLTDDLTKIEEKIADGYSVLVFPEGTRTVDGSIGRFHRGAFFLAERYGLDIVPVVLHGLNEVLPKVDLLLRKGNMTVRVLPRIAPGSQILGEDYRDATRNVRHLMTDTLRDIAAQTETADYFANRVNHNYIYKGAEVERSVRRVMMASGNYSALAEALPGSGSALMVEPGYGAASLVCALVKKALQIDALIDDEMTRALAANCPGVPANLRYISSEEKMPLYDMTVFFDEDGNYRIEKNV